MSAITLANRWWSLALRGAAAIIFGILTFTAPGSSLFALVVLFGVYAIVDGVLNLVLAAQRRSRIGERPWRSLVLEGVVSVVAGVLALLWPGITALVLLFLIAAWAVVKGVAEIVAAIRLRHEIRNEWMLILGGLVSVAFGVLLFARPGAGALAVALWIGAYAIIFGALMLFLSFKLRSINRRQMGGRPIPTGRVPTPA